MIKEFIKSVKELEETRLQYEGLSQQLKEKIESRIPDIEVTFSCSNQYVVHLNNKKEGIFPLLSLSLENGDIKTIYANIKDSTLEELLNAEKIVREEISK